MSGVMYRTPASRSSGNGSKYFTSWCSGVYAPDDGAYGSMVLANGGDGDYWGNEVYKFSFDTRQWSRECERSTGLNGRTSPGGDPNFDEVWGEHISPGGTPPPQPGIPHSYDQAEYLPPALGGGERGSFMFCTRTMVYTQRGFRHPHVFDLRKKSWRRGSATPGIVSFGASDAPTWCFDSRRKRFWGLKGGTSAVGVNSIHTLDFNPATGLATSTALGIPDFRMPGGLPVSRYWPKGDLLLVAGRAATTGAFMLYALPLSTPGRGFSPLKLTGDTIPAGGSGYGLAYCDDLDAFFVRPAGAGQTIYRIKAGDWVVSAITMAGDTVVAGTSEYWKRFMYVPPLKCLAWVDDVSGAVYAYRPTVT